MFSMNRLAIALIAPMALINLTACGDDPVSYSAPVSINLKAKSDSVVNNVVSDKKGITTESGNPYGAFISEARKALDGQDPGSIELVSMKMLLGANSKGVTMLGEVFSGSTEVLFEMNDTDNTYIAGNVDIAETTAGGPLDMDVTFDAAQVMGEDWQKLLGGSFEVIIRGQAGPDFQAKGAEADIQVTFQFEAFE